MSGGDYFDNLPELVHDSRLQATFGADGHQFYTTHPALGNRRARSNRETWFHLNSLGQGGQGSVELQVKKTGTTVPRYRAVKKIVKSINPQHIQLHRRELIAMFKFSQPKYSELFVRSYGWYTSDSHIYLAMEYIELGDLQKYMTDPSKCPNECLPESDARVIASQVLDALLAMHQEGFSHRDLKPANILIKAQPPSAWWVKLADFGISKRGGEITQRTAVHGTPNFIPPELLGFGGDSSVTYSFAIDMWCFGETLFRILAGCGTFRNLSAVVSYCQGSTAFPAEPLNNSGASEEAATFVRSLMAVNPSQRLTAAAASDHPWMQVEWKEHDEQQNEEQPDNLVTGIHDLSLRNDTVISKASASWTDALGQEDRKPEQVSKRSEVSPAAAPSGNEASQSRPSNSATVIIPSARHNINIPMAAEKQEPRLSETGSSISKGEDPEVQAARKAVKRTLRETGHGHPDTLTAMYNLAKCLDEHKKFEEAYKIHEEVFQSWLILFVGDKTRTEVQKSQLAVAKSAFSLKKYDVSAALFQDLYEVQRECYGDDNPIAIRSLEAYGESLKKQDKVEESLAVARKAAEFWARRPGQEVECLNSRIQILWCLDSLEKYTELEALVLDLLPFARQLRKENHPKIHEFLVPELLLYLGSSLHVQSRDQESEPIYYEAMGMIKESPSDKHRKKVFLVEALEGLSHSRWRQNKRNSKTERLWREYLECQKDMVPPEDPGRLEDLSFFADFLRERGKIDEAEAMLRETLSLMLNVFGDEHSNTLVTTHRFAVVLFQKENYREAAQLLEKSLRLGTTLHWDNAWLAQISTLLNSCNQRLG